MSFHNEQQQVHGLICGLKTKQKTLVFFVFCLFLCAREQKTAKELNQMERLSFNAIEMRFVFFFWAPN